MPQSANDQKKFHENPRFKPVFRWDEKESPSSRSMR